MLRGHQVADLGLTPQAAMTGLGHQVVLDLYDCVAERIDSLEHVQTAMLEAARAAGATIVCDTFHRFSPWGVSGVVVIAESHLAIHTWPERNYAAVDVFTCGPMGVQAACDLLVAAFGSIRVRQRSFPRGEDLDDA